MVTALGDYGLSIAGIVAGLTAIGWMIRGLVRWRSKTYRWVKDVGTRFDAVLDLADYQLRNNGGGSLIDKVERTEEKITHLVIRFDEHLLAQTDMLQTQADANKAMWPAVQAIAESSPHVD